LFACRDWDQAPTTRVFFDAPLPVLIHIITTIRLLENRTTLPAVGDISNDVGEVKTHIARSGRRSRLSKAKSRRRRPWLKR
jgi:hypothetical protein